jgi:spore coat polysaccharide biosynthesis protein SpsF (cytidylyltransferase family)
MQSSRIPNKVMTPICDRPILDWIVDRLVKCKMVHEIAVAVPNEPESKPIIDWAKGHKEKIYVIVGSSDDVLDRICQCAWERRAHKVIRITGDLPFISYEGIDILVNNLTLDVDYVNNIYGACPWLDGTSSEVAWTDACERANRLTPFGAGVQLRPKIQVDGTWRVHGFHWMANSPEFKKKFIDSDHDVSGLPHLLVDEPKDLKVAEFVMGKVLGADDSYETLLKIVRENKKEIERIREG